MLPPFMTGRRSARAGDRKAGPLVCNAMSDALCFLVGGVFTPRALERAGRDNSLDNVFSGGRKSGVRNAST